mgnify:FL=1
MNIKRLVGASALLFAITATSANATSVTASGPSAVDIGQQIVIELQGDFVGVGMNGGGLDFTWDDALVSLDSVTLDVPNDPALSCGGASTNANCPADTSTTTRVAWGTFGSPPVIVSSSDPAGIVMATLTFTALAGGNAAFSMADAGLGWLNEAFSPVATPDFLNTSVTINAGVVPVPAAVWLFGSGLIGLVGMARRKKAA